MGWESNRRLGLRLINLIQFYNMVPLQKLEKFTRLLHGVQRVKRVARLPDEKEMSNTVEHSFKLAMLCWYIADANKLTLNYEKIFKYALAHDVIEAYAGDTPTYDTESQKTKHVREAESLNRIESEFPEFSGLTQTIHEYESRSTPEARFVYAADKLIDPLEASMETTQSMWKEFDMSWDSFISYKKDKIAMSEFCGAVLGSIGAKT